MRAVCQFERADRVPVSDVSCARALSVRSLPVFVVNFARAVIHLEDATTVSVFSDSCAHASSACILSTQGSYSSSYLFHQLCGHIDCAQSVNSSELQQFLSMSSTEHAHRVRADCQLDGATIVPVSVLNISRSLSHAVYSLRRQLCARVKCAQSVISRMPQRILSPLYAMRARQVLAICQLEGATIRNLPVFVVNCGDASSARSFTSRGCFNGLCLRR